LGLSGMVFFVVESMALKPFAGKETAMNAFVDGC
jgi:hypothetical protein